MDYKILLATILLLSSCCVENPLTPLIDGGGGDATTKTTTSTTAATTGKTTSSTLKIPDQVSNIYADRNYERYGDTNIKEHAAILAEGCENDECKTVRIQGYVIENYYFQNEPQESRTNRIAALTTTGYGDSQDFATFYYNYLKAVEVETYLAPLGEEVYALACGLDRWTLQREIEKDALFKEYAQENTHRNFRFEINNAFGENCIRLEGPSKTKGLYIYPGETRDIIIEENKSFYVDPADERWEPVEEAKISGIDTLALVERRYNFTLGEKNRITWGVARTSKRVDKEGYFDSIDYSFAARDISMKVNDAYATFTLPETNRFDRLRLEIDIKATQPFRFYTLQDKEQISGLEYSLEDPEPEDDRTEKAHIGNQPWEFDYLKQCSQEQPTTTWNAECTITDAGRRVFILYNEQLVTGNQINVTVRYLEWL